MDQRDRDRVLHQVELGLFPERLGLFRVEARACRLKQPVDLRVRRGRLGNTVVLEERVGAVGSAVRGGVESVVHHVAAGRRNTDPGGVVQTLGGAFAVRSAVHLRDIHEDAEVLLHVQLEQLDHRVAAVRVANFQPPAVGGVAEAVLALGVAGLVEDLVGNAHIVRIELASLGAAADRARHQQVADVERGGTAVGAHRDRPAVNAEQQGLTHVQVVQRPKLRVQRHVLTHTRGGIADHVVLGVLGYPLVVREGPVETDINLAGLKGSGVVRHVVPKDLDT